MNAEAIPNSALRVTSHEVLALLSFGPGPGADLSRKVLVLADLPEVSDLVRAGLATLHVRDMAEADGEGIHLRDGALVLSVILSTATGWFEATRYGATSSLPAYIVSSPHGKAAIFLRPLSQYLCLPLRADMDIKDFLEQTVNGLVAEAHAMDGGLVTVRRHRLGAETAVANVKVNADGSRQLAALPLQDDGQLTLTALDESQDAGACVSSAFRD
ncbi:hypothetical protein [Arthrobacter glacialis]|uniref:hypothetical protein n=1 Tax=Arthrobacter glacialis TaxID=1664 RepID=UPI000CD3E44E|nr:hypothetical protein [Arthrobacter glacialis]POH56958.1 hypothetical protein CVS28_17930 [Arthrobacter glacialis]